MKTLTLILLSLLFTACASTPTPFNKVSHKTLGQDFVKEKTLVCEHFKKSEQPLVTRTNYMASFMVDEEVVQKRAKFVVEKKNLPAWHCNQTAWSINPDVSQEVALGREQIISP